MITPRTVVFGLDGAHFELISSWIERGELPNVQRVLEEGIAGDLESVLPPVTSPNWKAYATGKNPGKLGIFWWENIDTVERRVYYPTHRKHIHDTYWNLLSEFSRVGVLGVPTTHPPSPIDGFIVSGAPDGENSGYVYPASVEEELEDEFQYRVTKRHQLKDQREAAVNEILDLIDLRFEAASYLADRFDVEFLQVTTFYLNSLHHYLWDNEATLEAWKIVDRHLGHYLESGSDVVLMSDHGSTRIRTVFNINTWLAERGSLTLDNKVSQRLLSLGINRDRIGKFAAALNLRNFAAEYTPRWILDHLPTSDGTVDRESKMRNVDWDQSTAIASGQGPVYLLADPETPEYERQREQLRADLLSLTGPDGESVVDAVHDCETVYDGPYVDEGPDLLIEQSDGVHISGAVGHDDVFVSKDTIEWMAENKGHGLFAAHGPSFGEGTVEDLSILDLAPTMLHLYGVPVPKDMDGKVRTDIFSDDADARNRPVEKREIDRAAEEMARVRAVARTLEEF